DSSWGRLLPRPYISNVLGYTALFASADLVQQSVLGVDWHQTARVATVGLCFHANFNYHWLRGLEKMLPGGGVKAVTEKVVVDQLIAAPLTISAFYIGMLSIQQGAGNISQTFWSILIRYHHTCCKFLSCSSIMNLPFHYIPKVFYWKSEIW
uniref:Si:ch211-120k19.1 n=2 Tax=Oreochromis TaxID=8139 RepID=A0A669F7C4_ORENI